MPLDAPRRESGRSNRAPRESENTVDEIDPADPDALFAAVLAKYQLTLAAGNTLTSGEQTTLRTYASAYKGPQAALMARYLTAMGVGR